DGSFTHFVSSTFGEIVSMSFLIVAVDIPIGFPDQARKGGRECDRNARRLLGRIRSSSVFNAPVRAALGISNYPDAADVNTRSTVPGAKKLLSISQQSFRLFPKMVDVDCVMNPVAQERIREIHPELCFYEMNGGHALDRPKRTPEGFAQRLL